MLSSLLFGFLFLNVIDLIPATPSRSRDTILNTPVKVTNRAKRFFSHDDSYDDFDYGHPKDPDFTIFEFQDEDVRLQFNDERWWDMWYLNRGGGLDLNVQKAWNEGVTGKGVVVTIVDDGVDMTHPDLIRNYDAEASYDVVDDDWDPSPVNMALDHQGTRCAGLVAAEAGNEICGVGVAYDAKVGGIRLLNDLLDGLEDRHEGKALSFNPQYIDIYSSSWGPSDDGATVDGPGIKARAALSSGVKSGRSGKGSIYIWAAGTGGAFTDDCNCDGYITSIETIAITSASANGSIPWYAERCSSILATTYSYSKRESGAPPLITTDLYDECTTEQSGTAASAPLAAGICALALQVNPSLTWRDMQHLIVRTSRPDNLYTDDWVKNGVDRKVSHAFGYGLMDGYGMVQLAKKWPKIPQQESCTLTLRSSFGTSDSGKIRSSNRSTTFDTFVYSFGECDNINILEHVQVTMTLTTPKKAHRGDLEIKLIAPSGTTSTLLHFRPNDKSSSGFTNWNFTTVHSWGENPFGTWTLEVKNRGRFNAQMEKLSLTLYGSASFVEPNLMDESPLWPQESLFGVVWVADGVLKTMQDEEIPLLPLDSSYEVKNQPDQLDQVQIVYIESSWIEMTTADSYNFICDYVWYILLILIVVYLLMKFVRIEHDRSGRIYDNVPQDSDLHIQRDNPPTYEISEYFNKGSINFGYVETFTSPKLGKQNQDQN